MYKNLISIILLGASFTHLHAGDLEDSKMKINSSSCPLSVIKHISEVDLRSSDNSTLFSWIAANSSLECQVYSLALVGKRLDRLSDRQVIGDFCSSAATYSKFLNPELIKEVKAAYLKFGHHQISGENYFNGLRYNLIDIRPQLIGVIKEDWSFLNPKNGAQTWHYNLYLASLGDHNAYIAIEKKLLSTPKGNDLVNLIASMATLKTKKIKKILIQFKNDLRHSDTPEGPGLTVGEKVSSIIKNW